MYNKTLDFSRASSRVVLHCIVGTFYGTAREIFCRQCGGNITYWNALYTRVNYYHSRQEHQRGSSFLERERERERVYLSVIIIWPCYRPFFFLIKKKHFKDELLSVAAISTYSPPPDHHPYDVNWLLLVTLLFSLKFKLNQQRFNESFTNRL